jgi:hypothetical protein
MVRLDFRQTHSKSRYSILPRQRLLQHSGMALAVKNTP